MKKISLQLRLTLLSSLLLTIACFLLTLIINVSASKMIEPIKIIPAMKIQSTLPMTEIIPESKQKDFRIESFVAMIGIILVGSATTYIVVGRAVKPIKNLTYWAKEKSIDTLHDQILLPKIQDEVYDLTVAFNEMSKHLEKTFIIQKQFSADVAHELRTPLAAMQTKIEVYGAKDNYSKELLNQIDRLTKLVDDLLWFSNDTPVGNISFVDMTQLTKDIAEELSDQIDEKQMKILISDKQLFVKGSDALLERVVYNLLQNAIKYSENSTSIKVDFDTNQKAIFILDEGIGISDDEKQLIFEPFYQIDKSRNHKISGNGLGLAICKKILRKHNATITAYDNKPKGTVFEIKFLS